MHAAGNIPGLAIVPSGILHDMRGAPIEAFHFIKSDAVPGKIGGCLVVIPFIKHEIIVSVHGFFNGGCP